MKQFGFVLALLASVTLAGCRRKPAPEPPLATPSVTLSHAKAPLGSPIDITYRFDVAPDAPPFTEDYRVFAGVVDSDEELMWNDDHNPPIPTSRWKPGQKIEYTRTIFIPIYPYIGEASVHVGLHSPATGKRLSLAGDDAGQHAYRVAKFQLLPQTENVFTVFKDGWHLAETALHNAAVEWQWTKKSATLAFKNPKVDSVLYFEADTPGGPFPEGQRVQVRVAGQVVAEFTLDPNQQTLHKIPLTVAQLGAADMVDVQIDVDKTFVPALLPGSTNKDPRELGIRVFHAFVEPKK